MNTGRAGGTPDDRDGSTTTIADWMLERYLLGELPPDAMHRVEAAMARDPELGARLETLRASDRELRERYPAGMMARRIRDRLDPDEPVRSRRRPGRLWSPGSPGWPGWLGGGHSWLARRPALTLATALAVILVLPFVFGPGDEPVDGMRPAPPGVTRIKGSSPELQLFRKIEGGSERLASGATVAEHDLIMVRYRAAGATHGAILSIDGRGTLTRHLPTSGEIAAPLDPDGAIALPFAYELDDAPGAERFYFITATAPFDLEPIVSSLVSVMTRGSQTGPGSTPIVVPDSLVLPEPLVQTTFTLRKSPESELRQDAMER